MIRQVSIVLAHYCPHCVPFSLQNAKKMALNFDVPLRILDIEVPEQEAQADRLVEEFGDWSEDYLIPQVFVEYDDGRVDHVLTGFSEAVSVTEAAWNAFFSSTYYSNLLRHHVPGSKPLNGFVENYLSFRGRCRRHCDAATSLIPVRSEPDRFVGAYICPDGYVSRVVYFSVTPNLDWFKGFLTSQVGEGMVQAHDLRPATRHGWELGEKAASELGYVNLVGKIIEVYWTVYPKTEAETQRGVFLCSDPERQRGCGSLFVQDMKRPNSFCPKCR